MSLSVAGGTHCAKDWCATKMVPSTKTAHSQSSMRGKRFATPRQTTILKRIGIHTAPDKVRRVNLLPARNRCAIQPAFLTTREKCASGSGSEPIRRGRPLAARYKSRLKRLQFLQSSCACRPPDRDLRGRQGYEYCLLQKG